MNDTLRQRFDRCQHLQVGSGTEQAVESQVNETGTDLQRREFSSLQQTRPRIKQTRFTQRMLAKDAADDALSADSSITGSLTLSDPQGVIMDLYKTVCVRPSASNCAVTDRCRYSPVVDSFGNSHRYNPRPLVSPVRIRKSH